MFTHRLVFPASVLRGRGAIKHLGAMCGRLGQRAMLVGGTGLWVDTAITQSIDPPDLIPTTLVQTARANVVVLGFQHDARQLFLVAPEPHHFQQ